MIMSYGINTPTGYEYKRVSREESEQLPSKWRRCVHLMLYCSVPGQVCLFNNPAYEIKKTAMMMMRHDGRLGFPGGFVDKEDPSLESALYRELSEEMGNLPIGFEITSRDYMMSHLLLEKEYVLHFFCKEVKYDEFLQIEVRDGEQAYAGFEVLGPVRVPLFVMSDRSSGLPAFLRNNFIGIAREQLLDAIRLRQLLTDEELDQHIALSKEIDPLSTN